MAIIYAVKQKNNKFDCSYKQLTSLRECPEEVNGEFDCSHNKLTTLEGCPKKVNGIFNCQDNNLTTLKGCPEVVNGNFVCFENQLTTLEGSPKEVNGVFNCQSNNLTTLEGGPKVVYEDFDCSYNPELKDISDLPDTVTSIHIYNCPNIEIFPKHIKDTLQINWISNEVLKRLKQQSHLEVIEEQENYVIIREKPLGRQLLNAI